MFKTIIILEITSNNNLTMEYFENLLNKFKKAFYSGDFDQQVLIHQKISGLCFSEAIAQCPEYQKFTEDIEYLDKCVELLESPDWETVAETHHTKVEARGAGNEFFTKSSVLINSSILKVMAVLNEIDLLPNW